MTRPWWPLAVLALSITATVGWWVLFHQPETLSELGRWMFVILAVGISLAPVLLIRPSEEAPQP